MRGTKPAGESQYGSASVRHPGRRDKTQKFDTSIGDTQLVLAQNPTINTARAAEAAAVVAARAVQSRRIGLARTNESGGQVLTLEIVSGGSGYSNGTNIVATGGSGTGLTVNLTQAAGVVTAAVVGNNAGRGYVVGDLLSENSVAGTGLSLRVASIG
jgi:hypothetical protein